MPDVFTECLNKDNEDDDDDDDDDDGDHDDGDDVQLCISLGFSAISCFM